MHFIFVLCIIAGIVIVPQVLRHQERQRLHDTIRQCLAKGQPVPPELFQALRWRRRVYASDYAGMYAPGYNPAYPGPAYAPPPGPADATSAAEPPLGAQPAAGPIPAAPPVFLGPSQLERDFRRGVVWVAIGLGLIAAGAAFYAGLYYDGGASETFSSFAAMGAIPLFVGMTYLALWFFNRKSKS